MKNANLLVFLIFLGSVQIFGLKCPKNDSCLCLPGATDFEFQCSINGTSVARNDLPDIILHIIENKEILIDCDSSLRGNFTNFQTKYLPNITVNNIENLRIRSCPLPKIGFKELLDHFNTQKVKFLQFGSSSLGDIVLSKDLFKDLDFLENIELNDNSIEHLDEDIFENLPNLTVLDLRSNHVQLKPLLFKYIPSLKILDLSDNHISYLPDNLFEDLSELKFLYMWSNNIRELNSTTFLGLTNLKRLELSSNKIDRVSGDAFRNLVELTEINLSKNRIRTLESEIFSSNKKLNLILIRQNSKLHLSDGIFSNLPELETVDLSECGIEELPESMFVNSLKLKSVSFASNKLEKLPDDLFQNLQNLEIVHLENNVLTNLGNFGSYNIKKSLYLQDNKLETIKSNIFNKLTLSGELNLSNNKIKKIDDRAFHNLVNLTTINLSRNQYMVQPYSDLILLDNLIKLKSVNMSHNHITQIENVINMYNKIHLEIVDLSFNDINSVALVDLQPLSEKLTINLESNQITTVSFERIDDVTRDVRDAFTDEDPSYSTIYLNNNPLDCNCYNYDLARYYQNDLRPEVRVKFDIKSKGVNCAKPEILESLSLEIVPQKLLICSFEELNVSQCINGCFCKYRPYDKSIIIDCSNQNLTKCPEIGDSLLISAGVDFTQIEMRLEGNRLKQFGKNCSNYNNVTKLFLSYNDIEKVSWLPPKLEILHLDHNKISKLDDRVLKTFNTSNLVNLTLDHNPWRCECGAENLTTFLREKVKIIDASKVLCINSTTRLINLNKRDLCPHPILPIYIALIVMAVALLIALLAVTYYRYQQPLKVWLYAHDLCLWWVTEEEIDKDKMYDAFISYSHKDEDFVVQNLLPVLEGGSKPYKLCIHYRHFIPGEFIATQVTKAVLESRRTLVVLSTNFLESIWGKMEFRTAHTQAMTEGRARVIIVLYGDIDVEKLDDELKAYLKTNTYVKWGDPYFWNKLRYALPHSRRLLGNNQKMANVMSCIDDKFKLVVPQTPNPGSTPPVLNFEMDPLKKRGTPPAEMGNLLV